ncbi:50S ribosomal protein L2 [Borrelia sp. BU AG58]|uniref:50S ribosomal protein L2 n=1 Tax=Borrelia sp. BU AG58 TaxID=2887345 RepID=UPI001E526603|nr:50S ribosomal protein L2 [Borrelia sp. BU AG58]UER67649.1 50S ribosomal protein L2 [Borrelia sp. BU AG58]
MGIKTYRPKTSSLRYKTTLSFDDLSKGNDPLKSLTRGKLSRAGRDSSGRISIRRRGGGHKRRYREIDFGRRDKFGVCARVASVEYDPNRSSNIALLVYRDGDKRYIIAPKGIKVGDTLESGPDSPIKSGNSLPLENIPVGKMVHNIELNLGKGGQLVRSAGSYAMILASDEDYVTVKLPSGEMRMVFKKCMATLGEVGNEDYMNVSAGKAGKSRWLGKRPRVRGVAMNPVDHPHGGGEGKTSGGRHPVSPWGQPTKGYKTRKKKKYSDKFIVKRRNK